MRQAARQVGVRPPGERKALVQGIVKFLRGTLLPHARQEEEVLYPEWARLVGFADAAAPMVHDHEAILSRTDALDGTDAEDVDRLQELLYGLHALISVHFRKEEDIQLLALDAHPEVAESVLQRMGTHGGLTH